jgi:hypothetical protein
VCTAVAMQRLRDRRIYKAVSGQRLGKHVPAATNTSETIEELHFLRGPCQDVISKGKSELRESSVWEVVKRRPEGAKLKNLQY